MKTVEQTELDRVKREAAALRSALELCRNQIRYDGHVGNHASCSACNRQALATAALSPTAASDYVSKAELDRVEAELAAMRAALDGFRWLANNTHNIKHDPDNFKRYFDAAMVDAMAALSTARKLGRLEDKQ